MGSHYNPRIVTNGLVLHLDAANPKSYPRTGTTWSDLTDRGNVGTLQNGASFNANNAGSIEFDGINDYVSASAVNVSDISLEVWVNWSSFSTDVFRHAVVSNAEEDTSGYMLHEATIIPYNRVIFFATVSDGTRNSVTSLSLFSADIWYHIIATYDGTNPTALYVNGRFDNSASVSKGGNIEPTTTAPFLISSTYTNESNLINGKVATVRVYNRVLSIDEIRQNFNATRGRFGV
jgi:hypothetical protein